VGGSTSACTAGGTGSTPPMFQGWQRKSRFVASAVPRSGPWTRSASTAYVEQEGWNRHRGWRMTTVNRQRWTGRRSTATTARRRAVNGVPLMRPRSRRDAGRSDQVRHRPHARRSLHRQDERRARRRVLRARAGAVLRPEGAVSRGSSRRRSRPSSTRPPSGARPSRKVRPRRSSAPMGSAAACASREDRPSGGALCRRLGARRPSGRAARDGRSRGELLATPAAAALDDRAARTGAHTGTEPVLALTATVVRLESALHGDPVPGGVPGREPGGWRTGAC